MRFFLLLVCLFAHAAGQVGSSLGDVRVVDEADVQPADIEQAADYEPAPDDREEGGYADLPVQDEDLPALPVQDVLPGERARTVQDEDLPALHVQDQPGPADVLADPRAGERGRTVSMPAGTQPVLTPAATPLRGA